MSKRKGDPGYAPGWCIHYRASGRFTDCEAGVPFSRWTGTKFDQQPCFLTKTGESKPDALPCEHLRRPTPGEIKAHEGWVEYRWGMMAKVLATIEPWRAEHRKKRIGGAQTIDCPACGGDMTLSMTIASNGHVHARCKTEGCVSWME